MATTPKKPTRMAEPVPGQSFVKITVTLKPEVAEMVRTAAFYTPGATVASIVAAGIKAEVKRLETKRGEPFPKKRGALKAGRPFQKT